MAFLAEIGLDLNARHDKYGFVALYGASTHGHESVVQLLLQRAANVNATSEKQSISSFYFVETAQPLHAAMAAGQKDVVKILFDHRADVCMQTDPNPMECARSGVTMRFGVSREACREADILYHQLFRETLGMTEMMGACIA